MTNPANVTGFQKEKLGNQSTRLNPFPCSAKFFLCGQFVSYIIHSAFQCVLEEMRVTLVVHPSGDKKRTEVDMITITWSLICTVQELSSSLLTGECDITSTSGLDQWFQKTDRDLRSILNFGLCWCPLLLLQMKDRYHQSWLATHHECFL